MRMLRSPSFWRALKDNTGSAENPTRVVCNCSPVSSIISLLDTFDHVVQMDVNPIAAVVGSTVPVAIIVASVAAAAVF